MVSSSAHQEDRRWYRYYIGLRPSHINTPPAEHAKCSTCKPGTLQSKLHHNTRLNADSSRMFGSWFLIEKHRTQMLLSAEKKESGSNKGWNVRATVNTKVKYQDVQNVHEWDKKRTRAGKEKAQGWWCYLSCDCSSYILSFPSLNSRMARLDFFIRLSM